MPSTPGQAEEAGCHSDGDGRVGGREVGGSKDDEKKKRTLLTVMCSQVTNVQVCNYKFASSISRIYNTTLTHETENNNFSVIYLQRL